ATEGLLRGRERHLALAAGLPELLRHLLHALIIRQVVLGPRGLADVLADLHRAELRAAHRAEVGGLERLLRQGFVAVGRSGLAIEAEVGPAPPADREAGA